MIYIKFLIRIDELIDWLNINLKGLLINILDNKNNIIYKGIFHKFTKKPSVSDKKLIFKTKENENDLDLKTMIFELNNKINIYISDRIEIDSP